MRLFHAEFGGQISWLLPAALISLAAMAWVSRRAPRTDRTRAGALLWGGWVLVTGLVFSYMNGIIHPYYMVALAPGIAALTGIGALALSGGIWGGRPPSAAPCGGVWGGRPPLAAPWQAPLGVAGRIVAGCGILASAVWAYILLDRTPDWMPWLRWVIVLAGVAAAGLVLAGPWLAANRLVAARLDTSRRARLTLAAAPLGLALVAGLAGPAAYALDTVSTAHTGAIPSAGPQAAGFGRPGGVPGGLGAFARGQGGLPSGQGGFPGGQGGLPAARAASPARDSPGAPRPGRVPHPARCRAEPVPAGCRGAAPAASAQAAGWAATPR